MQGVSRASSVVTPFCKRELSRSIANTSQPSGFSKIMYTTASARCSVGSAKGVRCTCALRSHASMRRESSITSEIADAFVGVLGSELDGMRSDKRDLLAYAIDRRKIAAARANGTAAAGVAWGYGSVRERSSSGRKRSRRPHSTRPIARSACRTVRSTRSLCRERSRIP